MPMQNHAQAPANIDEDLDVVAIWLRKDPARWIAGIFAGAFAGLVAIVFAMFLCKLGGMDPWSPIKVGAIPLMGGDAMELGVHMKFIVTGLITELALAAWLGFCYAHFTGAGASPKVLLGASFTWGCFSWIFIFCLYIQSFTEIKVLMLPKGPAFFIMMVYGLSLASVSFFDRMFRRN